MSTNKHFIYIAAVLVLVAVVLVVVVSFKPGTLGTKAASKKLGYEKYFNEDKIMTVDVIVDDSEWETMLKNAKSEEYIKCDVIIDGERIDNVGIRPKGNSSLQLVAASNSDRYSFKIEFDHYVKNQTFHGLDKLVLNNTQADASYMKEFMSYEIYESIGVAVPLHSYAQIKLNGENDGFYIAIESMEESYASRIYGSNYGQLYKPESVNMRGGKFGAMEGTNEWVDFKKFLNKKTEDAKNSTDKAPDYDNLQSHFQGNMNGNAGMPGIINSGGANLVYTDDKITSYSAIFDSAVFNAKDGDFKRVIKALKNLNSGTKLEKYINIDDTLRYFAAQTFIINFDSYYGELQHNYYLYEKGGQLTMLPWDLNLAFAGFDITDARTAINYPIDTPLSSGVSMSERPMLSKLLKVPEYKKLYHKYLNEIVQDYVESGKFADKINRTDKLIKSYVEIDTNAFYTAEEYEAAVPVLKQFGILRAKSIEGQLKGTIPSTSDGQSKDSSSLVDTGDMDLPALGSQGGNACFSPFSIVK